MKTDGYSRRKAVLSHILVAAVVGLIATAAASAVSRYRRRRKPKPSSTDHHHHHSNNIIPRLDRTESSRVGRLEPFSHYVARLVGFGDASECPHLCKLANDYVKGSKGPEDHQSMYDFFASNYNNGDDDDDGDEAVAGRDLLYVKKLVEELDRCVLSYFAFHWSHASLFISQVLSVDSEQKTKLKDLVMTATRKRRFEKVSKELKVKRVISTLVKEVKAIGGGSDVMVPVAHSERSPVLLLMGGGMGAGKSTVLKGILKESFWSDAAANAVVVEADAFKETDVIYRALSSKGHHHDMLQTAELVHQSSTDAASSLLVTALNEGRDVIMDGTLSWEPFVEQTIAMARNVHKCRYRMGIGYNVTGDGTVTEDYWEQADDEEEEIEKAERKPYRIELVGVVCDAYLAVVRGIRRAIMMSRAVRVNSQLNSHKRFASAFRKYCELVDNARLYTTNVISGPPRLIGWKDGDKPLLVDTEEIKCLSMLCSLNPNAESIYELYGHPNPVLEPGSVWKDTVLSPSRASLQLELKTTIQKIEEKLSSIKT